MIILVLLLSGCRSYRPNIMFQPGDNDLTALKAEAEQADRNYVIRPNDFLTLEVYTNKGERIIDPDFELSQGMQRNMYEHRSETRYLVQEDGAVKLPVVGSVKVEGYTLNEAESILEETYGEYYNDVFVILKYANKRVVVLGAIGGHVIPLENENVSILEILALAGGLNDQSKAYNIRLIRGDLDDPEVAMIDLSTIDGLKKASLKAYPNDIIYIEPVRRVAPEALRDITPILSLVTSMITLVVLLRTI